MSEIEVEVKYSAGHTYKHKLKKTELYCICCGVRGVWEDTSSDDYYIGTPYYCTNCSSVFYSPSIYNLLSNEQQQIIHALKQEK